jgi:tape measure domain-containing protein
MAVNVVQAGGIEFDASINLDNFEASLHRMQQGLNSLADAANNQTSAIENLAAKAATAIGAYLTINAAKSFVSELVNVRGEFEQLGVAFRTMLGNKEQADKLMAQSVQLAATTPFKLSDVATGAKQLLAYGTAAEKIPDTLKMLGNVASGVSAPLQDIVYLYGTLQTQGRAYTRDILQFTSRGIPIIGELAKQFGVTTSQVQELVEAGKVGFPQIQKAFQTMTAQGGMFFNLMEEQSKTVTGMLSNLGDAFDMMLNNIGQSNEGIIKDSIVGLTTLVKHYQDVIDVLKVLLATYGAYKTAVIAVGAYNAVAAEAVAGYTLAETLRYRAMILSEGAMDLLNKTMLANPYVAVATAVTALVGAFMVLHDTTTQVKDSQHLLADAQKDIGDKMAATEAKIRPYVEALKGANVSENERLTIYNKLKAIDPSIVDGLTAKTIGYDALTKNVNKYLESLRNQISLEANGKAVAASVEQENNIQKQIDDLAKLQKAREKYNKVQYDPAVDIQIRATDENIKDLTAQLEQQKKVTHDLGEAQFDLTKKTETTNATQKRTVEVIDAQISELKKQQVAVSASSKEWQDYQTKIVALQKEREAITGKTSQQLKAQQGEENKINSILNERQGILDRLAGLQRDSQQSGLLPNDSAVDNIKQKYDNAIKAIEDYNKKVAVFNKQNGTKVQGIGIADVDKLKQAEQQEIANTIYKQDSANYLASLDDKKKAFEDFQAIQQQGNDEETAFAKQKYAEQIGNFNSFLDYLKSQQSDLQFKISVEPNNVGLQQSLLAVNKAITAEQNKQSAANIKQQIDDYTRLFAATATFNSKRKSIDEQYYKDVALLARQYSGQELQDRLEVLTQSKQSAIDQAKDEVFQKTELYQKLNVQIVELTRSQIKSQIEAVQTVLSKGVDIPPALKQQLQSQLDSLQKSLNFSGNTNFVNQLKAQKQAAEDALATGELSTEEYKKQLALIEQINDELKSQTIKTFQTISNDASQIAGAFSNLASAVQPLNAGLADTLQTLSDIGQIAGNAAGCFCFFCFRGYSRRHRQNH